MGARGGRGARSAPALLALLALLGAAAGAAGLAAPPCDGMKKALCRESSSCRWGGRKVRCVGAKDACDAVQGKKKRKKCGGVSALRCQCSLRPLKKKGKCGTCVPTQVGEPPLPPRRNPTAAEECEDPFAEGEAKLPEGLCVRRFVDPQMVSPPGNLWYPRAIICSEETGGDLLVLDRGRDGSPPRILALRDRDGDGVVGAGEFAVLLDSSTAEGNVTGLNHGIAVHSGFLYASSFEKIWRWPYQPGQSAPLGAAELVIDEISRVGPPGEGGEPGAPMGHKTRTLVFDNEGRLYVSVGSVSNWDGDSYRSRIRRFPGLSSVPAGGAAAASWPIDFRTGEVFADGLRNEVGLAWQNGARKVLWGVENGGDNLSTPGFGDIHQDNPAEELNRFPIDQPGRHYGYPWCFSEYNIPAPFGGGAGTQWAFRPSDWPGKDDAFCKAPENNVPPALSMQAHSAPLGLRFYGAEWANATEACATPPALPCSYLGSLFVSFHGSWNRDVPTGYKVVRVPFSAGLPVGGDPEDFLRPQGPQGPGISGAWPTTELRPVDLAFGSDSKLFVTAGKNGELLSIYTPDLVGA